MQSILIDTSDQIFQEKEIERIKEKCAASSFDIHTFLPSPSLGISEVRKIQHIITRKPFQGKTILIILTAMEKATIEAQNALLKILEEPPFYVQFILTTENRNTLLPTILSRAKIITNSKVTGKRGGEEVGAELFQKITTARIGKRILISQELAKSKEDTLAVLTQLEIFLEQYLYEKHTIIPILEVAKILSKIEYARQFVERNINYKTILDLLFISFPRG